MTKQNNITTLLTTNNYNANILLTSVIFVVYCLINIVKVIRKNLFWILLKVTSGFRAKQHIQTCFLMERCHKDHNVRQSEGRTVK